MITFHWFSPVKTYPTVCNVQKSQEANLPHIRDKKIIRARKDKEESCLLKLVRFCFWLWISKYLS